MDMMVAALEAEAKAIIGNKTLQTAKTKKGIEKANAEKLQFGTEQDLESIRAVGGGPTPPRMDSRSAEDQEVGAFGLAASVHCPAGLAQTRYSVKELEVLRHLRRGPCW